MKPRTYPTSNARRAEGLSVDAQHRLVAAMHGAGLSTERIASWLKMGEAAVKKVVSRKIKYNIDGLKDVWLQARESQAQLAVDTAHEALLAMKRGVEKPDCPPHHAAAVWREINNALRYFAPEAVVEERKRVFSIDLKDPVAVRELFAAMRGDKPTIALPPTEPESN
jgi:hypothetical protein